MSSDWIGSSQLSFGSSFGFFLRAARKRSRLDDLERLRRRRQHDGEELVGVERDARHQLVELGAAPQRRRVARPASVLGRGSIGRGGRLRGPGAGRAEGDGDGEAAGGSEAPHPDAREPAHREHAGSEPWWRQSHRTRRPAAGDGALASILCAARSARVMMGIIVCVAAVVGITEASTT